MGSKAGCDYALCYLKTGLLLESWPMATLVGWAGGAGMPCAEQEGGRRLHVMIIDSFV